MVFGIKWFVKTFSGLDIDERLPHIYPVICYFETQIAEYVKYSKCIPGFKQLCQDDQAALIKGKDNLGLNDYLLIKFLYMCF